MVSERSNNRFLFSEGSPFAVLNESDRLQLSRNARSSAFAKGEFIHRAGDSADGIFCVLSGAVRFSSSDSEGRYVLVQDLRPGDWFGIMGYFGDGIRPQDSNALEPSQLAFLKGTYLDEVLDAYPQIYRSILHQMASYSTDFFSRYFSAVNLSLRSRIAQMLLKIAQWQSVLELNITQTDLASLLGVTREAVGGHLNELQKIGAIELGYKKIILLNPELLSEQFSGQM